MKLYGTIAVRVQAADILRAPRFFDRLRSAFGGKPDLRTGKMRAAIEATAIVEATRDALRQVGATNALSLVIDDTVLFHDRDGTPDDLGDLFLAFHDNASVFGQGFTELRLAVEHREAGLHLVIEVQGRTEHARGAPAVRMLISGRVEALTPRPGEDADAYRARAEPIASDPRALETFRLQFDGFVARVRDAIAAAMPTAHAEIEVAEARVVRPDARAAETPQEPSARAYDPYVAYYPSPMASMADMFLWSAMFSMMMPPHFVVVDHANHVQGYLDDPRIQDGPTMAASSHDDGSWWDGNDAQQAITNQDSSSDSLHDAGGDGWWGDDAGGGLDSGDFGSGDLGGGDLGGGDW
ncbi:MAG TPA: hypothetical protein VHN14_30895 [Kofleriaceae bacterium]|jgi:hypothetical protein|nr:hypothetical protein [Kofleriaceae bacterium]